ncbi:MAG: hypothetical protein LBE78_01800 [Burkholderiaceae bacterium]|jgi:hypothetical protein|nr:hypothetical protein [Burkholderiaceae bacterium]
MPFPLIAAAVALALPFVTATALAAQTSKAPKAAAATAKVAAAAKRAPAKKTVKRKLPRKTVKAVEAATPVQSPSERLTEAELAIAKNVYTGTIACELGASVTVTADEKNPGFFEVTTGKLRYYMHPVESRTGSIRMEDNRAGAMWLQLGSKSMLMNQKLGQRLADECATPRQREHAAELQANPPPNLLGDLK